MIVLLSSKQSRIFILSIVAFNMAEDEEVIATVIRGITNLTGNHKFAGQIRENLKRWKTKLWVMSLVIWTSILFFLVWRN